MREPLPLVLRRELVMVVIAKFVEVACWRDEFPVTVRLGVESAPVLLMVVVPVCPTPSALAPREEVKKLDVVALVVVLKVVVSPPLNARAVVVALLMNR